MSVEVKDTSEGILTENELQNDGAGSVEETQPDYKALYEKAEKERENLATLIGRQGQELGELRKMMQPKGEPELDPNQYFDAETAKAIEKVAEQKAKALLESYQQQQEQSRLRTDFQQVYNEFDVTEENLQDLAYYASAKGVTIRQAAEALVSKGIIDKRTTKAAPIAKSAPDLDSAPVRPKVSGATAKAGIDPARMTQEQWNAMSATDREAYLRKVSGR